MLTPARFQATLLARTEFDATERAHQQAQEEVARIADKVRELEAMVEVKAPARVSRGDAPLQPSVSAPVHRADGSAELSAAVPIWPAGDPRDG